jgi:hypothetical protein
MSTQGKKERKRKMMIIETLMDLWNSLEPFYKVLTPVGIGSLILFEIVRHKHPEYFPDEG